MDDLTLGALQRQQDMYIRAVGADPANFVSVNYETEDGRDYVVVGSTTPSFLADLSNCVGVREQTPMEIEPWEWGEPVAPEASVQARYLHRMLVPRDAADVPSVESPSRRRRWRRGAR